jgi:CO/xanthine dehydrogenase FAD-binding subunit
MIPFDFEYHRQFSVAGAIQTFLHLDGINKKPMYYGGGTEIISMARMNNISTGAVIDIKGIPECNVLEFQDDYLCMGAALTLTKLHEANLFPLLSQAAARVADHTIQNKITLGGNICGSIIYKEALLPLLLTDSELTVQGEDGTKIVNINEIFKERIQLDKGEFIVQVRTHKKYLSLPYIHVKRTKQDKIHYPLVTICALKRDGQVRTAFSGVCEFPFRSTQMEAELNNRSLPIPQRVDNAIKVIPGQVPDNIEGSSGYRLFILKNLLTSIVTSLEDGNSESNA